MKVSFGEIISNSFAMMFKNKWLYVLSSFAIVPVLAVIMIFLGSFVGEDGIQKTEPYRNNFSDIQNQDKYKEKISPETAINSAVFMFLVLLFIIIFIILGLYLVTYSSNALLYGVSFISENEDFSITEASLNARKNVWPIIGAHTISSIFSSFLLTPIIFLFNYFDNLLQNDNYVIFAIIGLVLSIFLFLGVVLIYYFSTNYLSYLILFKKKKFTMAIVYSYKLAVKNIFENFVYSFLQFFFFIFTGSIGLVVYLVLYGLLLGVVSLGGITTLLLGQLENISLSIIAIPTILLALFLGLAITQAVQLLKCLNSIFFYTYNYLFNKEILKNE